MQQTAVVRQTRLGVRPGRQLRQVRRTRRHGGRGAREAHPSQRPVLAVLAWLAVLACIDLLDGRGGPRLPAPNRARGRGGGTARRLPQGPRARGAPRRPRPRGEAGRGVSQVGHSGSGDVLVEGVLGDGPRELLVAEALPDAVVLVHRHRDGAVVDGARDVVEPNGLPGICGSWLWPGHSASSRAKKVRMGYLQNGLPSWTLTDIRALPHCQSPRGQRRMTAAMAFCKPRGPSRGSLTRTALQGDAAATLI